MKTLKNKFIKRITFLLTLFLGCLAVSSISAQNCDTNTQKSLEQTRVSYYKEVTTGADAKFVIRYPLVGTTYTISDNDGNTYSLTHTSAAETIEINAGAVHTLRRFSLKAQKGDCVYQTGFGYSVTPVSTLKLATRVEHEWCGGGVQFTLPSSAQELTTMITSFSSKKVVMRTMILLLLYRLFLGRHR